MAEYFARLVLIPAAFAVWIGQQRERWREWRRARDEAVDGRVFDAIRDGHNYGLSIGDVTRLGAGSVYVSLARLERAGRITSRWEDDPGDRPRRRLYSVKP